MIKAVIFDMDGLLIDSEHAQSDAFKAVLRQLEKTPDDNGLIQTVGISELDNWKLLKEQYDLKQTPEELKNLRAPIYDHLLKTQVKLLPYAKELVIKLHQARLPLAIGSSSTKAHILVVVEKFDLKKYFSALVSKEDVKRGKPHPDIFLRAAELLQTEPQHCAVLEDSPSGIKAACAAGMMAIAVPGAHGGQGDFSEADYVAASLSEVFDIINNTGENYDRL